MKVKDDAHMTKSAADAFAEAVSRHAVAIVTNNEAGEALRGVGSGAAIRWNGRQLILTARHVVRDIILIRVKTGNPKGSLVVRSDNRLRDRHHSVEDE